LPSARRARTIDAMTRPLRILFIDDDPDALKALERIAAAQQWEAHVVSTAKGAMAVVDERSIEVVVSDHWMPGLSGIDFLAELKAARPGVVRVLMSGAANKEMTARAVQDGGVHAVVEKPWSMQALLATIRQAGAQARSIKIDAKPDLGAALKAFRR
jgi:DNA-binding NtrC family response regulator